MNNENVVTNDDGEDLPPPPEPLFFDDAMRSISLRVPCSDWGKMRAISERFRLRESEIFRFGLKIALERLDPLFDSNARGIDLAPLLVALGPQLVRYFELDTKHLDVIVNGGVTDPARRMAIEDLELLAMLAMPNRILYQRLQKLVDRKLDPFELEAALTEYLHGKYCGGTGGA